MFVRAFPHASLCVCIRAVESEFKSNPIFPNISDFPIFYPIFIRFFPIFRFLPTFILADSTALVCILGCV